MKLSEYNDMMSPEDLAREKMFNEFLIGIDDLINNADKYIEKTTSESKFQSVMPRSPFEKGLVKVSENPDVFKDEEDENNVVAAVTQMKEEGKVATRMRRDA